MEIFNESFPSFVHVSHQERKCVHFVYDMLATSVLKKKFELPISRLVERNVLKLSAAPSSGLALAVEDVAESSACLHAALIWLRSNIEPAAFICMHIPPRRQHLGPIRSAYSTGVMRILVRNGQYLLKNLH